ncbi:hypothetical protein FOZ62_022783 [Perkinsus olseni]|uniref:Exostosin GT47 domain-containing protein n=1 Tax=Perkinsus olseni TaxID=32597 RepID=A0A7J6R9J7_PEROL|nr:hypothetical protein FOZ62_022783 [Perkinsus olseni]
MKGLSSLLAFTHLLGSVSEPKPGGLHRPPNGDGLVNTIAAGTIRNAFHVLKPSEPFQDVPGLKVWRDCEYFGFQYSMEWYFMETLAMNRQFSVDHPNTADYVLLGQCVSFVYFWLRESRNLDHWPAIKEAERSYLIPLLQWAHSTPLHRRFNGSNFIIVFSMDLGRQDFSEANYLLQNWSVGSLTGSPQWLDLNVGKLDFLPPRNESDECYLADAVVVTKDRDTKPQDFVIGIPSRFNPDPRASETRRPYLLYFAGSPNSCARRRVLAYLDPESGGVNRSDILVTTRIRGDREYRQRLWATKYCLVMCGSSHTNNVRLYDVILHGCIPVIISDDFEPPLPDWLPWNHIALFLRPTMIPDLEAILRSIPEERRLEIHARLVKHHFSAMRSFEWRGGMFWMAMLSGAAQRIARQLSTHPRKQRIDSYTSASAERFARTVGRWLDPTINETLVSARSLAGVSLSSSGFGCADAETLLPALRLLVKRRASAFSLPLVLIDGGANIGKSSSAFMETFGDVAYRRVVERAGETILPCIVCPKELAGWNTLLISVEPHSGNFKYLQDTAREGRWDLEGWVGVQAALSDRDGEGLFQRNAELDVDEVGVLLEDRSEASDYQNVDIVQTLTLDSIYRNEVSARVPNAEVFLIKLDIEGQEPRVLQAARFMLITPGRVKFVVFEYSRNTWRTSIGDTISFMWSVGYMCFLITEPTLWPIGGPYWNDVYQSPIWSNILCGRLTDPDLVELYNLYNDKHEATFAQFVKDIVDL